MKKKEWNEGLNHLDPDLVEKYAMQKDGHRQKNKKTKDIRLRFGVIAACFVLILSTVIVVPMLKENNRPDVPTWDTAQYSADEIANLFSAKNYDGATNAYTMVYVPNSKYLYINEMTNDEYINVYRYVNTNNELSEAELKSFIETILPKLAESLGISVPQYTIKEYNYSTANTLSARIDTGSYYMTFSQNDESNSLGFGRLKGDRQIVIEGETVQIDQRLSDEEILESIQSIKNKLFSIFNVSFSDVKIIRQFGSHSEHGAEFVSLYFYDENAHPLNSFSDRPISDYIYIGFDNFGNYSGDIVSDGILKVSAIDYVKNRSNVSETYTVAANAKKITVSEAEALLYNGYVFGGHSCPICMRAQNKVDFEGYDFVDMEYVFGYDHNTGKITEGVPFYTFYKNIGTAENGNTIYAKTYVPAVQVSGYKEYFESQKDNHRNN